MKIKTMGIRLKIKDKGRSYTELIGELRNVMENIDGFVEISDVEVSDPIEQKVLDDVCERELTVNQQRFVEDALAEGLEVDYDYSGRGMYGKTCPAVRVGQYESFETQADYSTDSMGIGKVYYARS